MVLSHFESFFGGGGGGGLGGSLANIIEHGLLHNLWEIMHSGNRKLKKYNLNLLKILMT